jgi:hypothetical protein
MLLHQVEDSVTHVITENEAILVQGNRKLELTFTSQILFNMVNWEINSF